MAIQKKLYALFASQGLRQSATTLVGSTAATAISAVALMIYSRILGPEKFGEFSVGFALAMILARINDFGMSTAILKFGAQKKSLSEKRFLFTTTLKYKALLSCGIIFIGFASYTYIAELFSFKNTEIILLAFTAGLAAVYYEQLLNTLQALHRFNEAVTTTMLQAVVKIAWAGYMLATNTTSAALTFGWYVAAPIIPFLFSHKYLSSLLKAVPQKVNPELQQKIITLSTHSAIGLVSLGIIDNIDILYLQKYLTTYEVGLYSGVSRIALLFGLAAYSLGNVLYPRVAQYTEKKVLQRYLKKAALIAFATVLGFICFLPFAKIAILATVGPQYLDGLPVLIILVAASFFSILTVPFSALFFSFNANWYFSIGGILQLLIILCASAYFIPIYGLIAAAWARLITKLVFFIFTIATGLYLYARLTPETVEVTNKS